MLFYPSNPVVKRRAERRERERAWRAPALSSIIGGSHLTRVSVRSKNEWDPRDLRGVDLSSSPWSACSSLPPPPSLFGLLFISTFSWLLTCRLTIRNLILIKSRNAFRHFLINNYPVLKKRIIRVIPSSNFIRSKYSNNIILFEVVKGLYKYINNSLQFKPYNAN